MNDYSVKLHKAKTMSLPSSEIESENNVQIESSNSLNIKNKIGNAYFNFVNKIKDYTKLGNNNSNELQNNNNSDCLKKFSSYIEIEKSYKIFFLFFLIGIGITMLSFLFLPMILIAPKKFVSLFSMGSLITIFSFIFYYGTYDFLLMLFNKDRRWFTSGFLLSVGIGVYFSFYPTYMIISIICSGFQMIVMFMFILSFIPGGQAGIDFMISIIVSPFKKIFSK
jgi:hypothetical protein